MKVKTYLAGSCMVLGLVTFSGMASENNTVASTSTVGTVSSIIDKMLTAYGGDTLLQANNIKVVDYNKGPWPGEGESPDVPELWRINEELTIDYKNQRKSLLSYRVPRSTLDLEKWVQQGDSTIMYDILHQKYSEESWANFDRLGASLERSSDTLQAKRLAGLTAELEYSGKEYYRGRLQQKLMLQHASGERYTYFVDNTSGLIHKILRQHPRAGDMLYVFSNHNTAAKLPYARDMNFFVNGQLRLSSVHRDLELNPDLSTVFNGFDHFTPWGETIDGSEFTAKKLSDGVYQAGKGRALTVFIEQADHYIAMGAAEALADNFAEIKKLSLQDKPLKYFVVTHHHNANVRGLNNAVALGATLVVAKQHQATILKHATTAQADNLLVIPERAAFTLGDLMLFDIATAHAQHYLLAYLPGNRMVLAEDHYVTDLKTAKPRIYHDMVRFAQALDELKLDVNTLVDIRGWRQFSMAEFRQWTDDFRPKTCPAGYDICAKG
ncbi:MAG: hypothetical protein KKE30_13085 [Gammaproteobacteria bacterium]|nr:hypothetical protein [Gammaproteobacteria bacterium]MBU1553625.1 hypothetical protein [Gammaproteobacteria bacterium]MBU2069272.1 hypothetical protein [Gammaproteobacteria bacterium]MBU2183267.1 hypothetical protein [Gammaproteobacteria bacterium]MBU2204482.1 hypothetical protein [Gammaproteobacteria bacterium]